MGERLARVCVCGGYYEARGSDVTILWKGGYVMSKLSGRTLLKMEFNPTRLFAPDDFLSRRNAVAKRGINICAWWQLESS